MGKTIHELGAGAAVSATDEFEAWQGADPSVRVSAAAIKTYAGVSGLSTADGGTAIADNKVMRGDGTTGIQGSVVTVDDAGVHSGATQLNVDNLRLDGNTLSSTNANGDIAVAPNGTGSATFPTGSAAAPGIANKAGELYLGTTTNSAVKLVQNATARVNVGPAALQDSSGNAGTFYLAYGVASATVPSYAFTSDGGTGIGRAGTGQLSVIAGSVEVARATAGLAGVSDGLTALRSVEANTAVAASPNLLAATESRKILHNTGATADNPHTLPAGAPIGYEQWFACQDTDGLTLTAQAGETIAVSPGLVSSAGGTVRSITVESVIGLVKLTSTKYAAISVIGTWLVT